MEGARRRGGQHRDFHLGRTAPGGEAIALVEVDRA